MIDNTYSNVSPTLSREASNMLSFSLAKYCTKKILSPLMHAQTGWFYFSCKKRLTSRSKSNKYTLQNLLSFLVLLSRLKSADLSYFDLYKKMAKV